ncbi:MAG: acyl-CoA dehydrogenase family protein [Burkholderiaceae bacterium]|nr:acyl-CoA dehydrogenase family protein [Burkholderiaceae bacterium]
MDLNPSPEQKMLRDAAQKYLRAEYGFDARNRAMASPGGRDPAYWARFAEFGWLGLGLPEDAGGFGGLADIVQVAEALGGALAVEPYVPVAVLAGQAIAAAGSAAQRQALLAPLVAGRSMPTLASSEAASGPSLAWVETRARRAGAGWVLDGSKTGVPALPWADAVVVSARTAGAPGAREGIGLFVVPVGAPGVAVTPFVRYDGMHAGELRLDGVRVGADAVLGDPEAGIDALERAVDLATVACCADAVGAMTQVLHKTATYLATRRQFDAPLASFQVLQHRLVDMFSALEASRSMVVMAALHADAAPAQRARAVSAAKAAVGERARHVAQQGIQLHGGVGMTEELDIGHYFRRLTLFQQAFGGTDHHLQRFASLRDAEAPA